LITCFFKSQAAFPESPSKASQTGPVKKTDGRPPAVWNPPHIKGNGNGKNKGNAKNKSKDKDKNKDKSKSKSKSKSKADKL